jgi:DNA-binding CsgD family transcriptional regulator
MTCWEGQPGYKPDQLLLRREMPPVAGRHHSGRKLIPTRIAAACRHVHTLSSRERTIFEFLGLGYDNRSIAHELRISERTVKRHITSILGKLSLESRLQAGLTALITGLAQSMRSADRSDTGRAAAQARAPGQPLGGMVPAARQPGGRPLPPQRRADAEAAHRDRAGGRAAGGAPLSRS